MNGADWGALLTGVSALVTSGVLLVTVLPVHRHVKEIVKQVQTENGDTLGEVVEKLVPLVESIAPDPSPTSD